MRGKHRLSNRMILTAIALIALLLPITQFGQFEAHAAGAAIGVSPANLADTNLIAGKSFYAYINVSSVTNMLGYGFILSYNTFVLTVSNTTALSVFTHQLALDVNDRTGYVAASYDISPPSGFNSTGWAQIFQIGFKVDYTGQSNLDIHDTKLWDKVGTAIAHTESDGYFRNVLLANIPTASFTENVTNPLQGQGIRFTATGSGGTISKYSWDFGANIYILPNGDGTYKGWTGSYRDWDDPLDSGNDADASVVSATKTNVNQSSTLQDPPTLSTVRAHTIRGVRLTVIAKNVGASDENIRAMLVIGGKGYNGTLSQPGTDYVSTTSVVISDWSTNPATASAWTWANIDSLEAGVRSQQYGTSFTQLSVTQMYVTVLLTTVDYTAPTATADYYYGYRGNYTVNLGVYNQYAVGAAQAVLNVKGHDIALTDFTYGGYKLLNPIADNYTYMIGSYTDWDDWPTNDTTTTMVRTRPVVYLKPNGAGTYNNLTMINIIPDGAGTYSGWTYSYVNWTDTPDLTPDMDTTTVVAKANNLNQSSTLANPPSGTPPRGYTIDRVRLTIVAKANATVTTMPKLRLMLVIGGKGYNGSLVTLTTTYTWYTSDWALNPATGLAWTWTALDSLEAGVRSQIAAGMKVAARVTQLYVSISTSGDYTAWSDYPTNDQDGSYLAATTNNGIETSAMTNHNTSQTWAINKIRLNYISRNTATGSDEKWQPVLVIGGTLYTKGAIRPGTSYSGTADYGEWYLNPATNAAWTWSDLDSLEAGFKSVLSSYWTGQLRVTQMWISVYADIQTSKLTQRVTENYDIQNVTIKLVARSNISDTNDELWVAVLSTNPFYTSVLAPMTITANTTWNLYSIGYDYNPWEAPGTPWTWDEINNLRIGVQQNMVGTTYEGEYQVTQLYVEVYGYTPPGLFTAQGSPPTWTNIKMLPSEKLRFLVTVANQGQFTESNFNVSIYQASTKVATQKITSLAAGNVQTLTLIWTINTPYNRTFIMSAKIDPATPIANEYDTADNTIGTCKYGGLTRDAWVRVIIAGDLNGDGRVNSLDLGTANGHWAPAAGTPGWSAGYNMLFDHNDDGYINSLDLGVVNGNWGRTYP